MRFVQWQKHLWAVMSLHLKKKKNTFKTCQIVTKALNFSVLPILFNLFCFQKSIFVWLYCNRWTRVWVLECCTCLINVINCINVRTPVSKSVNRNTRIPVVNATLNYDKKKKVFFVWISFSLLQVSESCIFQLRFLQHGEANFISILLLSSLVDDKCKLRNMHLLRTTYYP